MSRLKKGFIGVIIVSMASIMAGCYLPKGVDDFSVMGNDTLSDLVRNSYGDGNLTPENSFGVSGVGRISKSKMELLANDLFAKQERNKIEATFVKNGGNCVEGVVQRDAVCSFVRKWKLKNIGAPFDTSNWSDPALKVNIKFRFDEHDRMQDLFLEIINVTECKEIRG
ncbi:hypothetical protein [Massilia antarctica]|uniref:hypothetical protein n=1 Tax=Massilia antarctica TaxID=2765360 RepID=UPI00226E31DA|nr:hypothetical protein [Massilia sp. H27-R4]MCY0911531.1 hypothetical protein [Massilia sp. H27-R4]